MAELPTRPNTVHLRFAVVDGPAGIRSVFTPAGRLTALALKDRHGGAFWCSTVAGGCGGRLTMAAGEVRRPYFRHHPGAACRLAVHPETAAAAYEHVRLQYALLRWLSEQGLVATVEHTFADGGGRADLHVMVADEGQSLEVQLSPINVASWQERDTRYQRFVRQVSWLYGTGPGGEAGAAAQVARAGVALQIRTDPSTEDVEVGVLGPVNLDGPSELRWSPLQNCALRPGGVWTPDLDAAVIWNERRREWAIEAARAASRARPPVGRPSARPDVLPLVVEPVRRRRESVAQWQQHRPVPSGWLPLGGWAWIDEVAEVDREGARVIAYAVLGIFGGGPVDMLDLDGLADFGGLLEVLVRHGVLHLTDRGGVQRWERGAARPIGA